MVCSRKHIVKINSVNHYCFELLPSNIIIRISIEVSNQCYKIDSERRLIVILIKCCKIKSKRRLIKNIDPSVQRRYSFFYRIQRKIKMLNVCLVYLLRELMLTVIRLNMNEPYFIVELEDFTLFLEVELCGSLMPAESKYCKVIEELLRVLRKDKVISVYKEMDMKTLRKSFHKTVKISTYLPIRNREKKPSSFY